MSEEDKAGKSLHPDEQTLTLGSVSESDKPVDDLVLGSDFGDYKLEQEIARGGMGVVYKATHKQLSRTVALKMVLSGIYSSQDEIERFNLEARAAANLDHSGIVPVYEVGEHSGRPYFSMGYVDGKSLSELLDNGPLEGRDAAALMHKVATAVAYAHDHGVVHRDIKPANILIDQDRQPKITDFGLAKRVDEDSNLTTTGQVIGTPSYMAPEQAAAQSEQIGPLSDVYALGSVLYYLVTARPPFLSDNLMLTLDQVLNADPIPPRRLNENVPVDLETICLKCLEKAPRQRYPSAQAVADELQRFLDNRPSKRAW